MGRALDAQGGGEASHGIRQEAPAEGGSGEGDVTGGRERGIKQSLSSF